MLILKMPDKFTFILVPVKIELAALSFPRHNVSTTLKNLQEIGYNIVRRV